MKSNKSLTVDHRTFLDLIAFIICSLVKAIGMFNDQCSMINACGVEA